MGDIQGMMKLLEEAMPADSQAGIAKRLQEGKFSLRDMYDQFQNIMKMGPLDKGNHLSCSSLLTSLPPSISSL